MSLDEAARARARAIAAAAPPLSPAIRERLRAILWGAATPEDANAPGATGARAGQDGWEPSHEQANSPAA